MNARTPLAALAAAALTVTFAACGSDDSSSSSDALSRADISKKADAVCAVATKASAKLKIPADFGQPNSDPAAAAAYLSALGPVAHTEADGLAALKPDDEVKADYAAFVKKEQELASFLDGVIAKAKAKDASGIQDLQKAPQLGKEFSAAANKVGAKGCATS